MGNGTGNTVFPIEYFVDEGKIYELAHFVNIQPINVSTLSRLSKDEKLRIFRTSSYALKTVHDLGIIHCDLKPDNIPISKSEMGGYVSKITDCGDAIFANNIPDENQIVCTEPYWSPELALYKLGHPEIKSRLSCKSDVFAMGLIFHEWWSGDFPEYEGRDDYVSLYQVVERSWPKKIKVDPSVPKWLGDLIIDMLYPVPEERPSMEEVFQAIKDQTYVSALRKPSKPTLSYDVLKKVYEKIPSKEEMGKYTEESVKSLVERAAYVKSTIKKVTTQEQINQLAALVDKEISALKLKPVGNYKKIEDAITVIESKDLSRFTDESKRQLLRLVQFAKEQKENLNDDSKIDTLYKAMASAFKALTPKTDFSLVPVSPLPSPYTKVEILSDDQVLVYYGSEGKIKMSAENAIKIKLVKRK